MKFGNLYAISSRNGLTKPRSVRGDGIKFVNMGELFENERIGNIEMDRVPVSKTEMRDALLQKDDLLFARQSLVREGAGKCSIITEVEEPTTFDSHLIRVRLNRSIANPSFYRYYFASPLSPMPGIVSQCAQAGIKGSDLKNLDVDCPSIEVQDKIASILGTYDELIENNRRQIKLLEEAAQRLYKEWFIDLKFPGHETVPIVDDLPEGWRMGCLGECCVLIKTISKQDERTGNELYIGLEHMPKDSICLRAHGVAADVVGNKTEFRKGDVLFGKIRPYFHKVGFAQFDGVTSTDAIVMRAVEGRQAFLLAVASSDEFVSYATATSKTGTKMPRADWAAMKFYQIPIPSADVASRFENICGSLLSAIAQCSSLIVAAREARDRLLPKLMSGEIEV